MKKAQKTRRDESTLIIDVNPMHRIPLLFANLVVFIFCCIVALVCVASIIDRYDEISFRNRSLLISFVVNMEIPALVASSLLLVISGAGFIGSLRENVCLLRWYLRGTCALLILTLLFITGCFVMPFIGRRTAQDVFNVDLVISYRDNPDYARLVDYAQESFECCGVTAQKYRDWNHNIYFNCSNTNPSTERCSVPASCCRPLKREDSDPDTRLKRRFCGQGVLAMTEQDAWHKIFTRSCVDASVTYVQSNAIAMMGTGIVVFAVLSLLRTMASTVHEEIISLEHLYEHYYKSMARGYKKSLARREALQEAAKASLVERHKKKRPSQAEVPAPEVCEDDGLQPPDDFFGPPEPYSR